MKERDFFQYRNHHHRPIQHTMMAFPMKHADRIRSVPRVHNRWVDENLDQVNLVSKKASRISVDQFDPPYHSIVYFFGDTQHSYDS